VEARDRHRMSLPHFIWSLLRKRHVLGLTFGLTQLVIRLIVNIRWGHGRLALDLFISIRIKCSPSQFNVPLSSNTMRQY
jgi:hypothetical protein